MKISVNELVELVSALGVNEGLSDGADLLAARVVEQQTQLTHLDAMIKLRDETIAELRAELFPGPAVQPVGLASEPVVIRQAKQ